MDDADLDGFIENLASKIVNRGLATPAILFIESSKPLTFIGSQALIFANPIVSILVTVKDYDRMISLLEDRNKIETLIQRIESLEDERIEREREKKKKKI